MTSAPPSPSEIPVDDPNRRELGRGGRLTLIAFGLVFASMVGAVMWSALKEPHVYDPLDTAATAAVREACDTARADLEALGTLPDVITREELADRIDAENVVYTRMVRTFASTTTSDAEGQEAFEKWTADWSNLVEARVRYAGEVLDESIERPELVLPVARSGSIKPVTELMDEYAKYHRIDQCDTVALQAEIVEGPRRYRSGP